MSRTALDVLTVMIVDDAATSLEVYRRLLRKVAGSICVTYDSPARALEWASAGDPGLVLVDFDMRITAIVNVFDALTSERPYKQVRPIAQAADRLRADGGRHFDPVLVSAFLGVLPHATEIKLEYSDARAA